MGPFRVRLNCIDHYQATPTKYDPPLHKDVRLSQMRKEPQVPVVRVFGSTESGQKVCAHIHGAFPYLYIEYHGSLNSDDVGAYIYQLHLSIDHALAVSYRRNVYGESPKFVARITLVKGIPFYGFYVGYRFYLKIYMLNPKVMTRLAELLQQGAVMNRKFQPFEAHLQFLMQFMTDYNLYGCDYIDTKNVCFRAPVPKHEEDPNPALVWHSQSVSPGNITDDPDLPRSSHCSVEVDVCVQDILNRHVINERQLHHDFIERNQPLPADVKLVHSMAGLWKDETKRRKRRMPDAAPGSSPFPPEVLVSMSADPRNSQTPGWIHEEEYRKNIHEIIDAERRKSSESEVTFDTFVKQQPLESTVNTLLQSVEDLYPGKLAPLLGLPEVDPQDESADHPTSSIMVDEERILALDVDDDGLFPDDSDEDLLPDSALLKKLADDAQSRISGKPAPAMQTVEASSAEKAAASTARPDELSAASSGQQNDISPWKNLEGVYTSRLQTKTRARFPVPNGLVSAAVQQGLVTKDPRNIMPGKSSAALVKRPTTPTQEERQPKRQRVEFALDTEAKVKAYQPDVPASNQSSRLISFPRAAESPMENTKDMPDTAPVQCRVVGQPSKPTQSSQSRKPSLKSAGIKNGSNQTIKFPVVKDPNDPNTRLRLSQPENSQHSQERLVKKRASFEARDSPTNIMSASSPEMTKKSPMTSSAETIRGSKSTKSISMGCAPRGKARFYTFNEPPPSVADVLSTMATDNRPDVIYQDAFYSNEKDVPERSREYAGKEFRLESNTLPFLPEFDDTGSSPASYGAKSDTMALKNANEEAFSRARRECTLKSWEIACPPPTFKEVENWWNAKQKEPQHQRPSSKVRDSELKPFLSQIEGATPRNTHGFKYSQKKKSTSVQFEAQYMSTMSLEIHVNTRGKLVPNPEEDEVQCLFWCLKSDENSATGDNDVQSGVIVLSEDGYLAKVIRKQLHIEVIEEASELDLMIRMVEIVRTRDPDIITGYEVHGSSWGYLIERARFKYDYNLCDEFSRMKSQSFGRAGKESDRWGFNTTSTIRVTGRHMINIWRAMRSELNLLQYTMENVAWHLLHRRIPHYPWKTLTDWYTGGRHRDFSKVLRYYLNRTKLDIDILEMNELIPRTSEQARLLGVDFFSVFSRGSQFKVESIMFRIAKPENFMLVSPDRKQVGSQNALECLPLVMEPQSAFYNSPLLVLDFQSLYPSVMIAYNYCYSTFLGRIVNWRGASKMGFADYQRQERLLELLKDHINIAPNGIMYCKSQVRKSLLAKMLTEILETRVMVKSGMKQDKQDKALQQLLNNRQLALKLLANVTYGYTSASFSGRMPCSEIADSIVQTGRETLERAIALIHSVQKWKAEVVYGDTDSLFVYLPGRTKDEAFDIGNEIAKVVTEMNPRPVKLKFEKVYHPCVLLAKKRYVGYKYESKDQVKPEFDAKGIETVRRDGTPAEQMIEEKALKLLFETADLSQVKAYFQKQCEKIMRGAVSIQDFCFAREVKLGTYSDKGPPPPGALISTKRMLEDSRAEPQYGERVPYVVVTGAPGARLIDRCIAPEELMSNSHLQLDAEYYISKNLIPPLDRIFSLVGADVRQWYDEMPKVQRVRRIDGGGGGPGAKSKKTLESYMKAASCLVCGAKTANEGSVCSPCLAPDRAPGALLKLQAQLRAEERKLLDVEALCRSCAGLAPLDAEVPCDSQDCPVYYTRRKQAARWRSERAVVGPAVTLLEENVELGDLDW